MIADLAAAIPDGATVALAQDSVGVAMAATRELVRRGARDLHLVGVPIIGLQADVLIGAGCVRSIETSAVTLGEFGTAPRFAAALKAGTIRVLDSTCPAIHAALQAGQKGLPFMPLRGLIGSDLVRHRGDWKVIDNPFGANDPIVLLPAIRPDVGLFHAPLADAKGNVWIGRQRDLLVIAQASKQSMVTVEAVTDEDLMGDETRAAGVIPAIYVTRIALAPGGARPLKFHDHYARDEAAVGRYAAMARTEAGFRDWLEEWLQADAVAA
jgi:glutaconate CoA-transferase subunit A